jgi:hypothetical protein
MESETSVAKSMNQLRKLEMADHFSARGAEGSVTSIDELSEVTRWMV